MDDFDKSIFILDHSERERKAELGERDASRTFSPSSDISETEKGVHIVIEIPGIDVNTLTVDVSGNRLTVAGLKEENRIEEGAVFLCMERHYGQFRKIFEFMGAVNLHSAKAEYRCGVLKIYLEKCEEKRGRGKKIAVDIEGN